MAAIHSNKIDIASSAGPRLALDSVSGSSPQFVPGVPAPNLVMPLADGVDEAAAETAAAVAVEAADRVLGALAEPDIAVEGAVGAAVRAAGEAAAEERTFGQKVLLHVWTSGSSKEISQRREKVIRGLTL